MAVNLPMVSRTPRLLAFFKGFLSTLDGLENYLFWAELQEVKASFEADHDSLRTNSLILYQEFIQPGARFEIVVPESERKKIFEKINQDQATLEMFDEVEVELILCLQNECIPKFLASEWYQRYEDQNSLEPEMEDPLLLRRQTKKSINVSLVLQEQSMLFDKIAELEKEYLERVRILVHGFKTGFESVLKKEDSDLLFGNVEQIYQVHQHISQVMVPDYPIPMMFQKAIFERHFLDIYTHYLTNLPFARLLLEVLLKDQKFSKSVQSVEKASKSRSKKSFEQLLFEVPLEHLKALHTIFEPSSISASLANSETGTKTQELFAGLLVFTKDHQPTASQKKLFELREKLVGYPGNLTKPDRIYIMEGPLFHHKTSSSPSPSPPPRPSSPLPLPPPPSSSSKRSFVRSISPKRSRPPPSSSLSPPPPSPSPSSSSSSSPPDPLYWFLFNDKLVAARQLQTKRICKFPNTLSTLSPQSLIGLYKFVEFFPLLNVVVGIKGGRILLEGVGMTDLCLESPHKEDQLKWCNEIQRVANEWKEQRQQQQKTKEQNLIEIVGKMKVFVECQDRGVFRKFKNCFTGTDGVYFFISKVPGCNTKEEAEALGAQLLQGGYIVSWTNSEIFKEKNSFYRFS